MEKKSFGTIDPDLFEYLAQKQFLQEPFARALLNILIEKGVCSNGEVMDELDRVFLGDINRGMKEVHED